MRFVDPEGRISTPLREPSQSDLLPIEKSESETRRPSAARRAVRDLSREIERPTVCISRCVDARRRPSVFFDDGLRAKTIDRCRVVKERGSISLCE
jgi:hypothetical protein